MRFLPTALNAPEARREAEEAVSEENSPVKEVGAEFKDIVAAAKKGAFRQIPGISLEGSAPARLSERARSRAAASWQVTGNWVLLLIAGIAIAVLIIELLEVDQEVEVSGIAWGIVVIWIVCQLMRLVMIMGYGEVRFTFNSSAQTAPAGDKEKDGGDVDQGGEENKGQEEEVQRRVRRSGGHENKGQEDTVQRRVRRGGSQ